MSGRESEKQNIHTVMITRLNNTNKYYKKHNTRQQQ